jgi:class 3 adenylate cyclase
MGKIFLNEEQRDVVSQDGQKTFKTLVMPNEQYELFNPDVLGLGDIGSRSTKVEALAAIFDLCGFTSFCGQVDPDLAVPEYLSRFLDWLFAEIKEGLVREKGENETALWASLPFMAKFLGDGVLFLWDTKNMGGAELCNVVTSLWEICGNYVGQFYPEIRRVVTQPPNVLRCGVARGLVFSVGNGDDYVGPCINIASRLQKVATLTFCVSRRGFDIENHMPEETAAKYVLKSTALRGIGDNELVWVRREEFENLQDEEKKLFRIP